MTSIGRRGPPAAPDIARLQWNDIRAWFADFARWCQAFYSSIPGGFKGTLPVAITPDSAGDAGLGNKTGWAAADHDHPIATASAVGLANANAEGTGDDFARASHTHKRDVRVKAGGVDVATRNGISFNDSATIDFQVADDAGNDEVDVTAVVLPGVVIPSWQRIFVAMGMGMEL